MSYDKGYSLNSHRIAGSYHWMPKLNGFAFMDQTINFKLPTRVFVDTGANVNFMPWDTWIAIYNLVCLNLKPGSECIQNDISM